MLLEPVFLGLERAGSNSGMEQWCHKDTLMMHLVSAQPSSLVSHCYISTAAGQSHNCRAMLQSKARRVVHFGLKKWPHYWIIGNQRKGKAIPHNHVRWLPQKAQSLMNRKVWPHKL